jgi:hypothetical protein
VSSTALHPAPVTICSGLTGILGVKKWLQNVETAPSNSELPPSPPEYDRCSAVRPDWIFLLRSGSISGRSSQFSAVARSIFEADLDPCRLSGRLNCSKNQALSCLAREESILSFGSYWVEKGKTPGCWGLTCANGPRSKRTDDVPIFSATSSYLYGPRRLPQQ